MKPLWRKQRLKAEDIVLDFKPGQLSWPVEMFEPLTIAACYPYLAHKPCEVRRSNDLFDKGRYVQGVQENGRSAKGPLLCKIFTLKERSSVLPLDMASIMLQGLKKVKNLHSTSRKQPSI